MITQLNVFIENKKGRLAAACQALADAHIDMHALFIADTAEYGIVRIICDTPAAAQDVLNKAGYRATLTDVLAISIPNEPGGLARLLQFCDEADLNIEYGYCFKEADDIAIDVLKVDRDDAEAILAEGGYTSVAPEVVYIP